MPKCIVFLVIWAETAGKKWVQILMSLLMRIPLLILQSFAFSIINKSSIGGSIRSTKSIVTEIRIRFIMKIESKEHWILLYLLIYVCTPVHDSDMQLLSTYFVT